MKSILLILSLIFCSMSFVLNRVSTVESKSSSQQIPSNSKSQALLAQPKTEKAWSDPQLKVASDELNRYYARLEISLSTSNKSESLQVTSNSQ